MRRVRLFGWLLAAFFLLSLAQSIFTPSCRAQSTTGSQAVSPPAAASTAPPADSLAPAAGASAATASASIPLTPLEAALGFYRRGNFADAITKYNEYIQKDPKRPDGYVGLVHVYLKQKDVVQAEKSLEDGLSHSDSQRMHVARAEVWFREGKIHEAEKEWVDVINSGFPEARAYLGVARVRESIAMYKGAKTMLDKAHEIDPNDPDIQQAWMGTLSLPERIKYLRDSLAGENNWDAQGRENAQIYLSYLLERPKKNGSCHLASNVTATEAPLVPLLTDPKHIRGYGLKVSLNGHSGSLLLDTGASGILVKRGVAEHAGISKITETKVWGVGDKGRRSGYFGVADSIKVGDLEFKDCTVEVIEGGSGLDDEQGLIGADVFEQFLVEIDFPNKKLKLSQLPKRPGDVEQKLALNSDSDDADADSESSGDGQNGRDEGKSDKDNDNKAGAKTSPHSSGPQDRYIAPEMQSYTHVFRFGHDLLIPTSIGKVPPKLFLLDTGAFMNSISPAAAREVTKVHGDSDRVVKGISGRVNNVYSASKAVLIFGHLKQENQDMTAFDTKSISDGVGTEVSGFLGFTTLGFLDIKIDYRDALVDFEYDAKRWGP